MNDLVIMKGQQAVTSSLQVAEKFEKSHKHVLETIDNLKEGVAENWADLLKDHDIVPMIEKLDITTVTIGGQQ